LLLALIERERKKKKKNKYFFRHFFLSWCQWLDLNPWPQDDETKVLLLYHYYQLLPLIAGERGIFFKFPLFFSLGVSG
jgi:hypothetical protein